MESQTLKIRAQPQLSTKFNRRGSFYHDGTLHFWVILLCALFCFAACGPCSMNGLQNSAGYDSCGSYSDNYNAGFQEVFSGDVSSEFVYGKPVPLSLDSVCTNSDFFCFPSTLSGFLPEYPNDKSSVLEVSRVQSDATLSVQSTPARNNLSWSSNCGIFKLLSGRVVSCSLNFQEDIHDMSCLWTHVVERNDVSSCRGPLLDQSTAKYKPSENSETVKSVFLDGSSSPHVEISPPLLDWGQKDLYFPSVAFLTVANTHSDNILKVFEPYSTNSQFYPCNFSEMMLGPAEVASLCFVFLPTSFGLSSGHLVLQTSSGGFLVQAKGFAVESPYGILPLISFDVSSSGRWSRNLSLFNPFNETLYVEEITAWISVSSGDTFQSTKAICHIHNFESAPDPSLLATEEWLDIRSDQLGLPLMAMRPHSSWEVAPHSSETIIELDFLYHSEGKISGAFCMQLLRSSKDKVDTVMVPLEAELIENSAYDDLTSPVSASLEVLAPCDANETVVVALLLRNRTPYLLSVVKISEIGGRTEPLLIKYMEGLILFPHSVTQVAVVTYTPPTIQLYDPPSEISNENMNCKVLILTNDTRNAQFEIPCDDIFRICSAYQLHSHVGYDHHYEKEEYANARSRSFSSSMQSPSQIKLKALEMAEADELVLGNWKSQGTTIGMSVLDDHELLFPMVQVGDHCSKWITVKNPSEQPVVMQVILNSGQIVDECRTLDKLSLLSLSRSWVHNKHATPTKYGFSMAESALTEAYVHPLGRASFGPIFFHPSDRCGWKSSVLIRNNLSGVEWLSLRGFGGSLSLVLLEGSEPVKNLEFRFNMPSLNSSPPDMLHHVDDDTRACSQPLSKELYAKNTGDLPLQVSKIEVSGTECGMDGFRVHACKGFALEPGESIKLLISFQADFSAAVVQRDLELALATGIFVIPMKASLPAHMLNFCEKSMFWMRVKKLSVAILFAASIMFLVFCCILPQVMNFGSLDYSFKSGKSPIPTLRHAGKSYPVHNNQKRNKFAMPSKMDGLSSSIGEEETIMQESAGRCPDGQGATPEQHMTAQAVNPTLGYQCQSSFLSDAQKEMAMQSSLLPDSVWVESSDIQEASEPGNLTVKIRKEKGRRRRKKKGCSTGLTVQFEVSSSQSGNSTPSPPLSPVSSLTPKRSWSLSPDVDHSVEARNPFAKVTDRHCEKSSGTEFVSKANNLEPEASVKYGSNNWFFPNQQKPSAPRKTASKPVLLSSATFPSTSRPASNLTCPSPLLASTSTIAQHVRAPGSKHYDQKTVNREEKKGCKDEFKYDIWGDHLFGLRPTGRSTQVFAMSPLAAESKSDSFFVRGPQTLVTNSQTNSVSYSHQEG
ncbi:unnamed protein product [Ilex paraguariensis]|uniref:Transmembrane protein 131-like N-terminal domain-containing protein n=1 Tax=Ilex paraguariensis TaxID=185542 RepID=A0ABC8THT2_9AQUA